MLMQHFLDDDFKQEYLDIVTNIKSEEYYINMGIAWYMATALAKQWETAILYLENHSMDEWVHNRTIQKSRESYRITDEQKEYLKTLKRCNDKKCKIAKK
jgi:3-methyladenine DNA glycosylase AlkD